MESLEAKIARVLQDEVEIVAYDPSWPMLFQRERDHLRAGFPGPILGRIEHFGSTAVPGLCAKPIIDLLVEVTSLVEAQERIAPALEAQGYDYFWRPEFDDDRPPYYAWFIRRDAEGRRTHHLHLVEAGSRLWIRLTFRDHLITHPELAHAYGQIKQDLARRYPHDRIAYTRGKTDFITRVTAAALADSDPGR